MEIFIVWLFPQKYGKSDGLALENEAGPAAIVTGFQLGPEGLPNLNFWHVILVVDNPGAGPDVLSTRALHVKTAGAMSFSLLPYHHLFKI
jgi:hypothetical protein